MIDILLVDDQALLCEVLKTWLDIEQDLQVVGVAHNGEEAITQVEKLQPDIVLMDIDMPQMNGLSATQVISQRFPQVKVIFLSGYDDDAYLGKSLKAGAKGYLLKNTTAEELVEKIHSVYNDINLLDASNNNQSLTTAENRLEELINRYEQKFKVKIAEYDNSLLSGDRLEEINQEYAQRFHKLEDDLQAKQLKKIRDLESKNQSNWESIRKELINVNGQFNQANRNLNLQFERQLNNLQQDLDDKLSNALEDWSRQRAALQEWAVQRDEMRPSLEEYESRSRHELITEINPLKASLRDSAQQFKKTRRWNTLTTLLSLIALGLSSYLLISEIKAGNSLFNPIKELTNSSETN